MKFKSINNRVELTSYIRRQLGGESHDLELSDDNISDAIDDSIEVFLEKAYDGSDEGFIELDLVEGQTLYNIGTINNNIMAVLDILSSGYGLNSSNQVATQQYFGEAFSGLYSGNGGGMLDYALTQNFINSMEDIIKNEILYNFNTTTMMLQLYSKPKTSKKVLLNVITSAGEDVTNFDTLYGHRFIKEYAVAKTFITWGINISKYSGSLFDGNLELNGELLLNEGKERLEKAENMLREEYQDSFGLIYK